MTRRDITRRQAPKGPFSVGKWSTWQRVCRTAGPTSSRRQPGEGACAPENAEWLTNRAASSSPERREVSGSRRPAPLYSEGWRVVAAMRHPTRGMAMLREATGAGADDDRLIGVPLDLTGPRVDRRRRQGDRRGRRRSVRTGAQRGDLRRRNGRGEPT